MRRLFVTVAALLLALVLLPARVLAEETTGIDWESTPLGTTAEEDPEGADVYIRSIKITGTNTTLVSGLAPTFTGAIDKSDPNYGNMVFRSECWFRDYTTPWLWPQHVNPPVPLKGERYEYYVEIRTAPGYRIADDVTISFLGRDYTATVVRVFTNGSDSLFYDISWGYRITVGDAVPLYRMYNTKTSEHLWTRNKKEYDSCGSGNYKDWTAEGIAWYAPNNSSKPVFRLYNLKSGDHHYTTSIFERDKLVASGQWRDEGVAFYSAPVDDGVIEIYRVYNGRLKRGQHHYTRSAAERDSLVANSGWKDEGVGFYGYKSEIIPGTNHDVQ